MDGKRQLRFYLASGYTSRNEMAVVSRKLESETGWLCTSRWLSGSHDGYTAALASEEDYDDVHNSDVMVLHHGSTTRGGKWVEMGMAIAWEQPIIINKDPGMELPVFAYLYEPRAQIFIVDSYSKTVEVMKYLERTQL